MRYRNLPFCFTLLFACLTPSAARAVTRSGGAHPASKKMSDAWPASAQKRARPARVEKNRKPKPPAPGFSKDLEALRAQFNKDKGHVRLLLLLSPT